MINNSHIKEYLDYYLKSEDRLDFSVLLNGEWGCGKTWFIQQYIDKHKESEKFLNISIFGTRSLEEIDFKIFQACHPLLSSKAMIFAGSIMKGILKSGIKVDFDISDSSSGSATASLDKLSIFSLEKDLANRILVIDDVERSSIPITDFLGFINHLLDRCKLKVILIANEREILENKNLNADSRYTRLKEKVVGKSFEITSELESALEHFLDSIGNEKLKKILKDNKEIILQTYGELGIFNMRLLKYSISDFVRFYEFLDSCFLRKEILEEVIKQFFLISILTKKGMFLEREIKSVLQIRYNFSTNNTEDDKIGNCKKLFPELNKYWYPIPADQIQQFFQFGTVDKQILEEHIKRSVYFEDENTPSWIKLWNFFRLDDPVFDELTTEVIGDLEQSRYEDVYEIIQVTGMCLFFISEDFISNNSLEIIDWGKKNVSELQKKGKINFDINEEFRIESSHGYVYLGLEIEDFQKFLRWTRTKLQDIALEALPAFANSLLAEMSKSTDLFCKKLYYSDVYPNYSEIPILKHMKTLDFKTAFVKLPTTSKKTVCDSLDKRFKHGNISKLLAEKQWLIELKELFIKEPLGNLKIAKYIIKKHLIPTIEFAVSKLNSGQI